MLSSSRARLGLFFVLGITAIACQNMLQNGALKRGNVSEIICLQDLPIWFKEDSPDSFKAAIHDGSEGLTDKHTAHRYEHMYHRYMSPIAMRFCTSRIKRQLRILEIGLGCAPSGGMLRNTPGGSAKAWRHIFSSPIFDLDLHIMEYDENCLQSWSLAHSHIAMVHSGDQNSVDDLARLLNETGSRVPFDIIIDDASHINQHQIRTLEYMIEHVAPGGIYVVEDVHASCMDWRANLGTHRGPGVGGTSDCMTTKDGSPTFFSKVVEWQKKLILNEEPFSGITHIDVNFEAVVFQKAT